jgi:hypothetical protein
LRVDGRSRGRLRLGLRESRSREQQAQQSSNEHNLPIHP